MKTQKFCFTGHIQGRIKDFVITVPVENGGVYTNKYCPQDLLTGGISFISAANGEAVSEFIADCQNQVIAMRSIENDESRLDVHIAGLMAVIIDHLERCGRLIFGDLLIYMDCFSLLLEADGFSEEEIRAIYPRIIRTIVELYPNYVFNTVDLSPFKGSHFDFVLFNVAHK
ncbi:hypothetical protein LJC54_01960 [Parabacteroides sp. OttesenSCG-928-J18]|nr:hypothetical protein [Parabacteroides sp. OttesenSCG-928-J18]